MVVGSDRMRRTMRDHNKTGQSTGSPLRCCVRVTCLSLFFCSLKVTETNWAVESVVGVHDKIGVQLEVENFMSAMVNILVLPRTGTVRYSQLRHAKKKAPAIRSAMTWV